MRPDTLQSYKTRLVRSLVYLQTHLDQPISLDELASVACFSPYHFHRIFRGMVGESVAEHVRRLRLERAAQQLRHSARPVTDIAFEAGYEAHESFTRAFHAAFGASPSEFRANHGAAARAIAANGVHYADQEAPRDFDRAGAGSIPLEVRKQHLPPMRVAFLRHVGPFHQVGATWGQLMSWAGRNGLFSSMSGTLGICHDDPDITPPEKLRYDAAIIVRHAEIRPEGEVGVQELAGGEYAVATHKGPYEKLSVTYARMCGEWLPESSYELAAAPALEFYRNSPMSAAPEDLLTEIYLPLAD
jgi:AraC family transcriptional regulator